LAHQKIHRRLGPLSIDFFALIASAAAQTPAPANSAEHGQKVFVKSCSFCHGTDATGGEGPNLILSSVVRHDKGGELIGQVIREGRPAAGMPSFPTLSPGDVADIVAFLHARVKDSDRRSAGNPNSSYALATLLTGNAAAGEAFFNGEGHCSECHSPTGDLAHIAKKYPPIELEPRFLWPAKEGQEKTDHETTTVQTKSGEKFSGDVTYQDAYTIALTDADGWYHSWPKDTVKFQIKDPLAVHRELLSKYTEADMHNMFAYLETLQ
jgi:cytochrome c oxidase cbb3-type subunit 3